MSKIANATVKAAASAWVARWRNQEPTPSSVCWKCREEGDISIDDCPHGGADAVPFSF